MDALLFPDKGQEIDMNIPALPMHNNQQTVNKI
jgi:hypothetical protein